MAPKETRTVTTDYVRGVLAGSARIKSPDLVLSTWWADVVEKLCAHIDRLEGRNG